MRSGQVSLEQAERLLHNRASLRSDVVRIHPGTPFGVLSDWALGFAGIPTPFGLRTVSS